MGTVIRLGPRGWGDLARGVVELAIARWLLAHREVRKLIEPADRGIPQASVDRSIIDRVGYAIPRLGPRVPWRADCLVQALAARRWLAREGVASDLVIGVRNDGGFAAHAWLKVGSTVVTGSPIEAYVPLLEADGQALAQLRSSAAFSTNQR